MSKLPRGTLGLIVGSVIVLIVAGISLIRANESATNRATVPEGSSCVGDPSSLAGAATIMPFPNFLRTQS